MSITNEKELENIINNMNTKERSIKIDKINLPIKLKKIGHIIKLSDNASFFSGRDKELRKMLVIQNKKIKNNVLLVGNPGVGKTSLVEAFAFKFNLNNIFAIDCAKLIADTEYRGSFESKVTELLNYAKELNLILFFDEIHALINLGKTTGGISITDILKPYLLDSSLRFIGATTTQEVKALFFDEAFKRRFTTIFLDEPSADELITIKHNFESSYLKECLLNDKETLYVIETLSKKLKSEYFPDKFIDFMDYYYACRKVEPYCNKSYKLLLEEYLYDKKLESIDTKC